MLNRRSKSNKIRTNLKKQIARKLRRGETAAEKVLWTHLRNRQFEGLKFLRQHPIVLQFHGEEKLFVADFYCHEKRLIIEVDGEIHDAQKDQDAFRDDLMATFDLKIIRVSNDEILESLPGFLEKLRNIKSY